MFTKSSQYQSEAAEFWRAASCAVAKEQYLAFVHLSTDSALLISAEAWPRLEQSVILLVNSVQLARRRLIRQSPPILATCPSHPDTYC